MPASKADWERMEQEYICGDDTVTLARLAAEHGVSLSTVKKRAMRGRWTGKREQSRNLIGTLTAQKTAEALAMSNAERNVRLADKSFDVADDLLTMLRDTLREVQKLPGGFGLLLKDASRVRAIATTVDVLGKAFRLFPEQPTSRTGTDDPVKDLTPAEVEELLVTIETVARRSREGGPW